MKLSARKPPPPQAGLTELRKRESDRSAMPSIADRFPKAGRFVLEFRLRDPSGLRTPSPYSQTYEPQMQAYFDLRCPLHDCRDGGFPLGNAVSAMLDNPRSARTGTATCGGDRLRSKGRSPCALEMTYTLVALDA